MAAMKEAVVPCGPILSTADIFREEQYRARNMFHVTRPPSGEGQESRALAGCRVPSSWQTGELSCADS